MYVGTVKFLDSTKVPTTGRLRRDSREECRPARHATRAPRRVIHIHRHSLCCGQPDGLHEPLETAALSPLRTHLRRCLQNAPRRDTWIAEYKPPSVFLWVLHGDPSDPERTRQARPPLGRDTYVRLPGVDQPQSQGGLPRRRGHGARTYLVGGCEHADVRALDQRREVQEMANQQDSRTGPTSINHARHLPEGAASSFLVGSG